MRKKRRAPSEQTFNKMRNKTNISVIGNMNGQGNKLQTDNTFGVESFEQQFRYEHGSEDHSTGWPTTEREEYTVSVVDGIAARQRCERSSCFCVSCVYGGVRAHTRPVKCGGWDGACVSTRIVLQIQYVYLGLVHANVRYGYVRQVFRTGIHRFNLQRKTAGRPRCARNTWHDAFATISCGCSTGLESLGHRSFETTNDWQGYWDNVFARSPSCWSDVTTFPLKQMQMSVTQKSVTAMAPRTGSALARRGVGPLVARVIFAPIAMPRTREKHLGAMRFTYKKSSFPSPCWIPSRPARGPRWPARAAIFTMALCNVALGWPLFNWTAAAESTRWSHSPVILPPVRQELNDLATDFVESVCAYEALCAGLSEAGLINIILDNLASHVKVSRVDTPHAHAQQECSYTHHWRRLRQSQKDKRPIPAIPGLGPRPAPHRDASCRTDVSSRLCFAPLAELRVRIQQRRNAWPEETEVPGIVRNDSLTRTRPDGSPRWEASNLTATPLRPHMTFGRPGTILTLPEWSAELDQHPALSGRGRDRKCARWNELESWLTEALAGLGTSHTATSINKAQVDTYMCAAHSCQTIRAPKSRQLRGEHHHRHTDLSHSREETIVNGLHIGGQRKQHPRKTWSVVVITAGGAQELSIADLRPPQCHDLQGGQLPRYWSAMVRLLASHVDEAGSIFGVVAPGFSHVGIVPDDGAGRRVFLGISRFPRPSALLHTRHTSHPSALKTLMTQFHTFPYPFVTAYRILYLPTTGGGWAASSNAESGVIDRRVDRPVPRACSASRGGLCNQHLKVDPSLRLAGEIVRKLAVTSTIGCTL
ncbi:hypothetical protein PR048_024306 [Dryococelus australis]|uniref:Uncharacterized protein n=1 Tax=Dryococelus australis TaxID=614101 RepID=A0ABQ9GNB7_9NEOP|nr:hypothetical protein PR048_024306 [Dryococelus australis]